VVWRFSLDFALEAITFMAAGLLCFDGYEADVSMTAVIPEPAMIIVGMYFRDWKFVRHGT